jgi:hypothetical protein
MTDSIYPIYNVSSDMYNAGTTEDGVAFIAERYFLVKELEDGSRFTTREQWVGSEHVSGHDDETDEYFNYFKDVRTEALAEATTRLLDYAMKRDVAEWVPIAPRYGSPAYV